MLVNLSGPARFNGVPGTYEVLVDERQFECLVEIGGITLWDAFDGDVYWQSNFGSPIYRRPSPFSIAEGRAWQALWRQVSESERFPASAMRCIDGGLGTITITEAEGWLTATTSAGNVTEFGPYELKQTKSTLRPASPERIDFAVPFDESIGTPRAKLTVGGRAIYALVDTGADHSIFDTSLATSVRETKFSVGGGGGHVEMGMGVVRDVEFGGARISEITPFLMPFQSMPGPMRMLRAIIGQDILARATIAIDYENKRITGTRERNSTATWPLDGPYTVASVEGEEGWYRIDTGSAFTLHKFAQRADAGTRTQEHRGIGGRMQVKPLTISSLQIHNARFSKLAGFLEFGAEEDLTKIAGNIGSELLKRMITVMDFSAGLASFEMKE